MANWRPGRMAWERLIALFSFNRFDPNDQNNSFIRTQPTAFSKVRRFTSFVAQKRSLRGLDLANFSFLKSN